MTPESVQEPVQEVPLDVTVITGMSGAGRSAAANVLDLAGRTLRDAAKEARRVIEDSTPGR